MDSDPAASWQKILYTGHPSLNGTSLQNLTSRWKKKIIFTELGYCSGNCPLGSGNTNLKWQEKMYEDAFLSLGGVDFLEGVFFWNWDTDLNFGGLQNCKKDLDCLVPNSWFQTHYSYQFQYYVLEDCASPQWKPAQNILIKYYGGDGKMTMTRQSPQCSCVTGGRTIYGPPAN